MSYYIQPSAADRTHSRRFLLISALIVALLAAFSLQAQEATASETQIKLLTFIAERNTPSTAMIKWTTQLEVNNDYFEIERSPDASTWEAIGRKQGAVNSDTKINYTFVDEKPLTGANYYRLHRVDLDGHSTYTDMASVTFDKITSTGIAVYPNPATRTSKLYIQLDNASIDDINKVTITDVMGQLVYQQDIQGLRSYQLDAQNLRSGVYYLTVSAATETKVTSRILIQ
jgi:hypothetical protein